MAKQTTLTSFFGGVSSSHGAPADGAISALGGIPTANYVPDNSAVSMEGQSFKSDRAMQFSKKRQFEAKQRNKKHEATRRSNASSSSIHPLGDLSECRFSRILSVDIDGTIANISERVKLAGSQFQVGSKNYWDCLLAGEHYHLDTPLLIARTVLRRFVGDDDLKPRDDPDDRDVSRGVVYLSGRRSGTEEATLQWLQVHGFPIGPVIHRMTGTPSKNFKTEKLKMMQEKFRVLAHIGDRLEDDGGAAAAAGIPFVHIPENDDDAWLNAAATHPCFRLS